MKWAVTAKAFNRVTGKSMGEKRTEMVDTETNQLFYDCETAQEVHKTYERFWNDLNENSKEVVFVERVTKAYVGGRVY